MWLLCWNASRILRSSLENLERSVEILVKLEDRCNVAAPIAIIGSRPYRDQRFIEHELVTFHYELMCSADQIDIVCVIECCDNVSSEKIASSTRTQAPSIHFFGIRPQQIAHRPFVRHLLFPVDQTNLIKIGDGGREAAMDAEDLPVDDGGQAEIVKYLRAQPPDVHRAVLSQTFVVESIHLRDLTTLMIPSYQRHSIWISHLESQQKKEGFDTVETAIDKVAHEEIVRCRAVSSLSKQLFEVEKLAMKITHYRYGIFNSNQIRL